MQKEKERKDDRRKDDESRETLCVQFSAGLTKSINKSAVNSAYFWANYMQICHLIYDLEMLLFGLCQDAKNGALQ